MASAAPYAARAHPTLGFLLGTTFLGPLCATEVPDMDIVVVPRLRCQRMEAPEHWFGDLDRLRLAQLTTARAIAERAQRSEEASDELASLGSLRSGAWRLLPDGFVPHAWQQKCLGTWLARGRGTVKVATGGGKTKFALLAMQTLQNTAVQDLRVAIVVPTVPLMYQWRDELLEGAVAPSDIALLGGGAATPDLGEARIVVAVMNSARDRLPKLVEQAGWATRMLLVVDECHRANATQAQRIFEANPAYTLGLSATPEQELEDEHLPADEAYAQSAVGRALGPIIFEFSLRQSVDAGLLTPFEIWHIGLPLSDAEAIEHRRLSDQISELRQALQAVHRRARSTQSFIAWCQTQAARGGAASVDAQQFIGLANGRKRLLYSAEARVSAANAFLQLGLGDSAGRAIVFHESIEHTQALYREALSRSLPVVLEHSNLPDSVRDENINLFRRGIARAIVSAKSLIEGFNVPSADLGIIAASTSSSRQRIQSLGRLLRKKAGGRSARVVVLYVRETEDEAIYEKSDWAGIVGAERNRYFEWHHADPAEGDWMKGLREVGHAPRAYRPPSHEIDAATLNLGDPYPAQINGVELRIDQQGNARDEAGSAIQVPRVLVAEILARNELRRARITPAGHLIVRIDSTGAGEPDWRFLGLADANAVQATPATVVRYRVMTSMGRRHLAEEPKKGTKSIRFALSEEQGACAEAAQARNAILAWTLEVEGARGAPVREVCCDGRERYWIEIGGEQVVFPGQLPALEFKE